MQVNTRASETWRFASVGKSSVSETLIQIYSYVEMSILILLGYL